MFGRKKGTMNISSHVNRTLIIGIYKKKTKKEREGKKEKSKLKTEKGRKI